MFDANNVLANSCARRSIIRWKSKKVCSWKVTHWSFTKTACSPFSSRGGALERDKRTKICPEFVSRYKSSGEKAMEISKKEETTTPERIVHEPEDQWTCCLCRTKNLLPCIEKHEDQWTGRSCGKPNLLLTCIKKAISSNVLKSLVLLCPLLYASTASALALDYINSHHGAFWTQALHSTQKDLIFVSPSSTPS